MSDDVQGTEAFDLYNRYEDPGKGVWRTAHLEDIPIPKMTDAHLEGAMRVLAEMATTRVAALTSDEAATLRPILEGSGADITRHFFPKFAELEQEKALREGPTELMRLRAENAHLRAVAGLDAPAGPPTALKELKFDGALEWNLSHDQVMFVLKAARESVEEGRDPRRWYSNGRVENRFGVVAAYHPLIHINQWAAIQASAKALAVNLKRWVWVCQAETRWVYIQLGLDDGSQPALASDQFIYSWSPDGAPTLVGCS